MFDFYNIGVGVVDRLVIVISISFDEEWEYVFYLRIVLRFYL